MSPLLPRRVWAGQAVVGASPPSAFPLRSRGRHPRMLDNGATAGFAARCNLRGCPLPCGRVVRELSASGYPLHLPRATWATLPIPRAGLPPASLTVSTAFERTHDCAKHRRTGDGDRRRAPLDEAALLGLDAQPQSTGKEVFVSPAVLAKLDAVAGRINELTTEQVMELYRSIGAPRELTDGRPCEEKDGAQRSYWLPPSKTPPLPHQHPARCCSVNRPLPPTACQP